MGLGFKKGMKSLEITLLILFLLITSARVFGQNDILADPILVNLRAKIISVRDSSAIPYANIINNRTHSGTITDAEGYFTMEMLNIDSLLVSSVGYEKTVIKIPNNYDVNSILVFTLKPVNYLLGEVHVKGERATVDLGLEAGTPSDIAPELRGDAFVEKPSVFQGLKSPASYLQYHFSKKEKEKRQVREILAQEKKRKTYAKKYNSEVVMELTGLNEAYADTFMLWFNAKHVLPATASEYQIRTSILEYYKVFKEDYGLE